MFRTLRKNDVLNQQEVLIYIFLADAVLSRFRPPPLTFGAVYGWDCGGGGGGALLQADV